MIVIAIISIHPSNHLINFLSIYKVLGIVLESKEEQIKFGISKDLIRVIISYTMLFPMNYKISEVVNNFSNVSIHFLSVCLGCFPRYFILYKFKCVNYLIKSRYSNTYTLLHILKTIEILQSYSVRILTSGRHYLSIHQDNSELC
jgi:hypothetical protein